MGRLTCLFPCTAACGGCAAERYTQARTLDAVRGAGRAAVKSHMGCVWLMIPSVQDVYACCNPDTHIQCRHVSDAEYRTRENLGERLVHFVLTATTVFSLRFFACGTFSTFLYGNGSHSNRVTVTPDRDMYPWKQLLSSLQYGHVGAMHPHYLDSRLATRVFFYFQHFKLRLLARLHRRLAAVAHACHAVNPHSQDACCNPRAIRTMPARIRESNYCCSCLPCC
jgi:hypothetical protein